MHDQSLHRSIHIPKKSAKKVHKNLLTSVKVLIASYINNSIVRIHVAQKVLLVNSVNCMLLTKILSCQIQLKFLIQLSIKLMLPHISMTPLTFLSNYEKEA